MLSGPESRIRVKTWGNYVSNNCYFFDHPVFLYAVPPAIQIARAKKEKEDDPTGLNSLMFNKNKKIPLTNKKKDKDYTQVSTYKPTGNLIYSNELLGKISNSMKKDK